MELENALKITEALEAKPCVSSDMEYRFDF